MLRASKDGARLFRNNVGIGWAGNQVQKIDRQRMIQVRPGDVVVRQARPLHAGLAKGSGDLIGWQPVLIQPHMVGKTVAVFVSAEAKTGKGRERPEQIAWSETVRKFGGIAGTVRSESDLVELLAQLNLELDGG